MNDNIDVVPLIEALIKEYDNLPDSIKKFLNNIVGDEKFCCCDEDVRPDCVFDTEEVDACDYSLSCETKEECRFWRVPTFLEYWESSIWGKGE